MQSAGDIIGKKRDGEELSAQEIQAFIAGIGDGRVSDAHIAAFTMATWFKGMNAAETSALTLAMRDSGKVLSWEEPGGPILDKHSTGGVGDMTSLILGPVIAACGGFVPMISGRGLGHTGGTLDKLESIPGFETSIAVARYKRLVRSNGVSVIGQSEDLAPADRRIYAVRDVTATVSSPPLMISSILSKKLAEGLDALVLDIKYGSGAFTPGPDEAMSLARTMTGVASASGLDCSALVTHMDAPLAGSAGNALEVLEVIRFLRGDHRHPRLRTVAIELSAELLFLGGLASSLEEGRARCQQVLDSGQAAERFAKMVAGQGGPSDILQRPQHHLPAARLVRPVYSPASGYVEAIDTRAVGTAVVHLGGGRLRAEDHIDPAVGLDHIVNLGEAVGPGIPLAVIHARDEGDWEFAAATLLSAFSISEQAPAVEALVHATVRGEGNHEVG